MPPIEKSDMVFIPDLTSAVEEPFAEMPTFSMIGDVCSITDDGFKPFDQYPRNVAKAAVKYMQDNGIADTILMGPGVRSYSFSTMSLSKQIPQRIALEIDSDCAEWNTPNIGDGYQIRHKRCFYHITSPHDNTFGIRNRISVMLRRTRCSDQISSYGSCWPRTNRI